MPARLTLLALLVLTGAVGCLETVEDPRPPPSAPEQDGGRFDPGRKPFTGSGYGSGSGAGSGGARDRPDAAPPEADAAPDATPDSTFDE